jgi:hypothetical protein
VSRPAPSWPTFVGRINALPGAHGATAVLLQIGQHRMPGGPSGAAGRDVTVYLRPEDVLARPSPRWRAACV